MASLSNNPVWEGHVRKLEIEDDCPADVFNRTPEPLSKRSAFLKNGLEAPEEQAEAVEASIENGGIGGGGGQAFADAVNGILYPEGAKYGPGAGEAKLTGRGVVVRLYVWSHRADRYGLFTALPPFVDYYSLAGTDIAAGAAPAVMYHLAGDDYGLYRFKAQTAAYTPGGQLDPVMWDALEPDLRADRRTVQQSWLEGDFEIGDQIQIGDYAGMYVGEIIVPGGKYPSVEGGFRPAFGSGGGTRYGILRDISCREAYPALTEFSRMNFIY